MGFTLGADIFPLIGLEVPGQGFTWVTPLAIADLCTFVCVELMFSSHNLRETNTLMSYKHN